MTVPNVPNVTYLKQAPKQGKSWDYKFGWDNWLRSQVNYRPIEIVKSEHKIAVCDDGTIGTMDSEPYATSELLKNNQYYVLLAYPATGILYVINNFLEGSCC